MSSQWDEVPSRRKDVLVVGIVFFLVSGVVTLMITYRMMMYRLNRGFTGGFGDIAPLGILGLLLICGGIVGLTRPAWTRIVGIVTIGYVVVYTAASALLPGPFPGPGLLYAVGGAIGAGFYVFWATTQSSIELVGVTESMD